MYETIRFYRQIETPSFVATPAAAEFDAATLAWVAAVVANGGTVSAGRKTLVDNLIVGLKADGVWTKLDRLWLFAGEDQPSALTDIIAASLATAANSPAFAANVGYTGDGATNYVDSNFNPSTAPGPNYVQDSASLFGWSNTTSQESGGGFGSTVGVGAILPRYIDDNCYWSINQNTNFHTFANASGPTGLYLTNRTGAAASTLDLNGTQADSDVAVSTGVPNGTLTALKGANTGTGFWAGQSCAFGFGGSLNGTDRANIYSRLRTYMTAVGVP